MLNLKTVFKYNDIVAVLFLTINEADDVFCLYLLIWILNY